MATELTTVNDCLAIMGEAPLNSLVEEHAYKAAALATLARVSKTVQSLEWWYNLENLTLTTNPIDGRLYLPGDVGTMRPVGTSSDLVQRGRVVYNLAAGTDVFALGFSCAVQITRILALPDVPTSVADLIVAKTVLEFQNLYDGDQTKTRNLGELVARLQQEAKIEHIRNRKVNLIETNERLARIRNHVYSTGRY